MLEPKHFQEQNSLFQRSTLPQSIFKIKYQRNRISPVIGSIANGVREPLRRLHFFCGFTSYNHLHYNLLVVFKRNKNKNKQAHEQKPNIEISKNQTNEKKGDQDIQCDWQPHTLNSCFMLDTSESFTENKQKLESNLHTWICCSA